MYGTVSIGHMVHIISKPWLHVKESLFILNSLSIYNIRGFPGGTVVKNQPANAGDLRALASVPGLGRCPGEGNGNPLQYSCLENPMDIGAWWATAHGVAKSQTQLSD